MLATAPATAPPTFSTTAALAMAGVSHRRADYWCTVGVFDSIDPRWRTNPGSGTSRRWTVDHVHALTVCGRLVDVLAPEEGITTTKNLPTVVLAHAVNTLARHGFPVDGVLMVNAEDGEWSDDPYVILGALLAGPSLLCLALFPTDRPAPPE